MQSPAPAEVDVDYFRAFEISAAGMAAQRVRMEAATLNLANMYVSAAPGTAGYRPLTALIRAVPTGFERAFDVEPAMLATAQVVARSGATSRAVFEPGHPDADAEGMVSYPAVDSTQEMMTVMTALRSYEANLAALQASRTMAAKALEIGGQ
jgi:flagellar basal-body rod protein FlgC